MPNPTKNDKGEMFKLTGDEEGVAVVLGLDAIGVI